jgi:hypothetical protein
MTLPDSVAGKVRSAVSAHGYGQQIVAELSKKERPREVTDIYRVKLQLLRGGLNISDIEFLKFFETLERAGAGKLIIEKAPGHHKFRWAYNLLHVVAAARGAGAHQTSPSQNARIRSTMPAIESPAVDSTEVVIPYKAGSVTVTLPAGFTEEDVDRLVGALGPVLKGFLRLRA